MEPLKDFIFNLLSQPRLKYGEYIASLLQMGPFGVGNAHYLHIMAQPLLQIDCSLHQLKDAALQAWECLRPHKIWAIEGDMGAGKTTFIHALCDVLKVADTVSSPTFSIINEYHFVDAGADVTLYHMDWYRLRDDEEARNAGVEDCLLQRDAYCAVEWPTNAPGLLVGLPHVVVKIELCDDGQRRIMLSMPLTSELQGQ